MVQASTPDLTQLADKMLPLSSYTHTTDNFRGRTTVYRSGTPKGLHSPRGSPLWPPPQPNPSSADTTNILEMMPPSPPVLKQKTIWPVSSGDEHCPTTKLPILCGRPSGFCFLVDTYECDTSFTDRTKAWSRMLRPPSC